MDQITFRKAKPEDTPALESIDSSFTTNSIYTANPAPSGSLGFTLTETPISPPLTKHFPDDSSDSDSESDESTENNYTLLAEDHHSTTPSPQIIGFIQTSYSPWNKRLTVTDIEISPSHRGRGVGRKLIDLAERRATAREQEGEQGGEKKEVKYLWLEVSNVDAPAIGSYLRMGFGVCGLDVSLYEGTEARGEVGVFMWRGCK